MDLVDTLQATVSLRIDLFIAEAQFNLTESRVSHGKVRSLRFYPFQLRKPAFPSPIVAISTFRIPVTALLS